MFEVTGIERRWSVLEQPEKIRACVEARIWSRLRHAKSVWRQLERRYLTWGDRVVGLPFDIHRCSSLFFYFLLFFSFLSSSLYSLPFSIVFSSLLSSLLYSLFSSVFSLLFFLLFYSLIFSSKRPAYLKNAWLMFCVCVHAWSHARAVLSPSLLFFRFLFSLLLSRWDFWKNLFV